jgi:hypothetical protein
MLTDTLTTLDRSAARPIHVVFFGSLIFSSALMPSAAAQDEATDDSEKPSIQMTVEKNPRDRSRQFLSQDDPGQTTTLVVENEITVTVKGVQAPATSCKATVAVSYSQLDTIADVESTIENADCAASSGDYTAVLTIRDENGESSTLEFEETWLRNDNQPAVLQRDYPIGENVELIRVRSRRISCTCINPPQE